MASPGLTSRARSALPATPAAAALRVPCADGVFNATTARGIGTRRRRYAWKAAPHRGAGSRAAGPAPAAEDDPNARDSFGATPLHRAALGGNAARVEALLRRGADPNARDSWDTSALMLAAGRGHAAAARLLLQHGAEADARDSCGRSALMAVALAGAYTQMANTVLARSLGFSSGGALEAARALVAAGADVHAADDMGFTPLARLAQAPHFDHYHADMARLLLRAGAHGGSALEAALRLERAAALEALIGAGVDAAPLLAERVEFTRVHRRSADDVVLLLAAGAPLAGLPPPLQRFAVDLALRSRV